MIKRTSIAILLGVFVCALTAGPVLAQTINGTAKNDRLAGTAKADRINGKAGDDKLFGKGGNDFVQGASGDDLITGSSGNDTLIAGLGRDQIQASGGDDTVKADNGDKRDQIFCGGGFDVARVDINDLIGGSSVEGILSDTTAADGPALTCEVLVVDGFRIPLGAIVALPADLESDVSLLLERFLADGELDADELSDLQDVFDLIEDGDDGLLRQLLDLLLG